MARIEASVLSDLDDTWIHTREIFTKQMTECISHLESHVPTNNWRQRLEQTNNQFYETHGVNPTRWRAVMESLRATHNLDRQISNQALEILMKIYETQLSFIPQAEDTLQVLQNMNIDFRFITHANEKWTRRKYEWLGLGRFILWENIHIVDENGHKTEKDWLRAHSQFGFNPETTVAVGDSPRSDILPAHRAGIKHLVLVGDPSQIWQVQSVSVDEIPSHTIMIPSVAELPNYLKPRRM